MHPNTLLEASAELIRLCLRFEHPADAVVSKFFRDNRRIHAFGPRERAIMAETVYNVLRFKLRYEHLAPSGSGPRERRLAILGWASYLDDQAKQTSADAGLGDRNFLKSALNENERNWLDQCDGIQTSDLLERHQHNLPEWILLALKEQLGDQFWPLAQSLQRTATLDLRVNTLNDKRDVVQKELKKINIASTPTPYSPWGLRIQNKPALNKLEIFERGAIEVQDEGSQLLALLVDAKRGEMVVDFCAGAGGKTLALGASMRSTGRLYAFDVSAHRLEALKPRLARSGLSNVHPVAIAHERDERVKRLSGKIDRVLVDAPCSGLGTLRRNPDLQWRQTPESVKELVIKQTLILNSAARLLKPGGRLIYATCSVLPQENEEIAQAFSLAHPDFKPLAVSDVLLLLGVAQAGDLCTADGMFLRLWPHMHNTDGFFAACWVAG